MVRTLLGIFLIVFGINTIRGDAETPGNVSVGTVILIFGIALFIWGFILPFIEQKKIEKQKRNAYLAWLKGNNSKTMYEVDRMTGVQFENFCAALLKKHGYGVSFTKKTGDQGVDLIAMKKGKKYAIQCKRYSNNLGNGPVQEVYAGARIYGCDIPVVMTNSFFTTGAIKAAESTGVLLWDRATLIEMHDSVVGQDE